MFLRMLGIRIIQWRAERKIKSFALPPDYLGFYTKTFVVFDILKIKSSFGRVETSSFRLKTIFRQHPETLFF